MEVTNAARIPGIGRSYSVALPIMELSDATAPSTVRILDDPVTSIEPATFGVMRARDEYLLDFAGIVGHGFGRPYEVSSLEQAGDMTSLSLRSLGGGRDQQLSLEAGAFEGLSAAQTTVDPQLIAGIVKSGFTIRHWEEVKVEFVPDGGERGDLRIQLPLLRVHCPRHAGCTAMYSAVATSGDNVRTEVTFLGVNGGSGYTLTWSATEKYDADDKTCTEVVVRAKVKFELGTILVTVPPGFRDAHGKGPHVDSIANAIYFSIEDVDYRRMTPQPLVKGLDCCQWDAARAESFPVWPGGSEKLSGKQKTVILDRAKQTTGRIGVGLSLQKLPISFGINFESDTTHRDTIETKLTSGARYLAYSPNRFDDPTQKRFFEVCWTTK